MEDLETRVTGDGSATLFSGRYAQTYHSAHGAVAESLHVFLEGSGIPHRLRSTGRANVLEVGFGTGLNFFLTAAAALAAGAVVRYTALERDLLPAEVVEALGYELYAPVPLAAWLDWRRRLPARPAPGTHIAAIPGATLELQVGEATEARPEPKVYDGIYHDGFSPDANPELWTEDFLTRLAAALAPGGALVTYTVKGSVRRLLAAAGLETTKAPGPPGGKREMLRATRPVAG